MIQANAKCIVNGDKVNETIMAVNSLMNVDIVVGNVDVPQVKYFPEGFLIVLPRGSSYANEELYYVDTNNDVASRWFVTSASQASTSPASTSGTPTGKQSTSPPTSKDRNSLGGTPNDKNRDKLNMAGAAPLNQGGAVAPGGAVGGGGGGGGGGAGGGGGGASGGGGGNLIRVGGQAPAPAPSAAPAPAPTSSTAPAAPTPTTATSSTEPAPKTAPAKQAQAPRQYINTNADGKLIVDEAKLNDRQKRQVTGMRAVRQRMLEKRRRDEETRRIQAEINDIEGDIRAARIPYSQVSAARNTIRRLEEELKNL